MKLIVWMDDEFQFVRDGEKDVYTLLPWTAKTFTTDDEITEFMKTYFPYMDYTILRLHQSDTLGTT